MVVHGGLLTNVIWANRIPGTDSRCASCSLVPETTCHVLRDCFRARRVWGAAMDSRRSQDSFMAEVKEWFLNNLKHDSSNDSWPIIFGITCWLIWKWRNSSIFDEDFTWPHNPKPNVLSLWREIDSVERTCSLLSPSKQNSSVWVSWRPPPRIIRNSLEG
ncbi:Ribonuclease H protein [Quillaja saponaria]|uniref:Ribonuclease H protein n=1 Tax=Quillaja saponaria TaxID=32244 RepID=A0AAD7QJR9_QUISA|nr:Ribonuclease H protein [Quillaja saponaria]